MEDPFTDPIADLRAFLAGQEAEEARLRSELLALQDRTRRAKRAIEVLTDRKHNERKPTSKPGWVPGQGKQADVIAALADGAITVSDVRERTGMAQETARRALEYLRTEERVRVTGTQKAGNSSQNVKTYALMPGANNGA